MRNFILGFLCGIFGTLSIVNQAYGNSVVNCTYNFGNSGISMGFVPHQKKIHREFKKDGHKYVVHVEDINKFAEVEDYISIENNKGHKITYALECSK